MSNKAEKPLLVTTEYRGVFFGYGNPVIPESKQVSLQRARMCVYWSADVRGVLGLAATGPSKDCRITPEVPAITLEKVTSSVECSEVAVEAWEKGPWLR